MLERVASQGYLILCSIIVTISLECGDGKSEMARGRGGNNGKEEGSFFGTFGFNSNEIPEQTEHNWNLKIKQNSVWEFVTQTRCGQMQLRIDSRKGKEQEKRVQDSLQFYGRGRQEKHGLRNHLYKMDWSKMGSGLEVGLQ